MTRWRRKGALVGVVASLAVLLISWCSGAELTTRGPELGITITAMIFVGVMAWTYPTPHGEE